MSRNSAPIQSSLEDVLTQLGAPDGYEDLSPQLDGRRVVPVFDLSAFQQQGGILIPKAQDVNVVGQSSPSQQDYAFGRINNLSSGANDTDTIIDLDTETFNRIRVQQAYLVWREQSITTSDYKLEIEIRSEDPGVAFRTHYQYYTPRGGETPRYLGNFPLMEDISASFKGMEFGDDGDERMELNVGRGTQGTADLFINVQFLYDVLE